MEGELSRAKSAKRLSARALVWIVSLAIGAAPLAAASTEGKLPDPRDPSVGLDQRLERLVERVRVEQSSLATLSARFIQRKESVLLVKPEEARGSFYYEAPDRVRWEYESPNPIRVIVQGEEMTTWYQDIHQAEQLKIGRYSDQVFKYLGASGALDTLKRYFLVKATFPKDAATPYKLELTPRFARVAERLKGMTLWIDQQLFVPVRLHYEEPDGDVTDFFFEDLQVNAQLPARCFDASIPKGVDLRVMDLQRGR
jgi:outer membrane lipoprotein-sorting protein